MTSKSHARQLADLVEKPVKDFDPEQDVVPRDSDDSEDESVDENVGTEHYVAVGKSKLRRNDPLSLGPQYRGAKVSREALEADSGSEDGAEDEEEDEEKDGTAGNQPSSSDASSDYEDAREEFDDPDEVDFDLDAQEQDEDDDAEIDSDDAFGESDEEKFEGFVFRGSSIPTPKKNKYAKRATAADFMQSDEDNLVRSREYEDELEEEDDEDDEMLDEDDDEDDEMLDEDDEDEEDEAKEEDSELGGFIDDEAGESDEGDEDSDDEQIGLSDDGSDDFDDDDEENVIRPKKPLREHSGVAASIMKEAMAADRNSRAQISGNPMDADIQKGKSVQRQRKTYDALLNIRIRLQKSLVAMNSLNYAEESEDQVAEPYEAAEKSAMQLWTALDDFRTSIRKGKKRKHAETEDTPTQALWDSMQLHEKAQESRRKQTLERWSREAGKMSLTSNSGSRFSNKKETPIVSMLSAEMADPERLIKRTRTPRSCAPLQAAKKVNQDESIFDDADFYQMMLKELVDQRSDSSGLGLQASTVRYTAVKEAKAKRHVDTKASKGRKMRFTVMPKLQNFMAPEDRRTWEQSAIDRFFGTLFGQKLALQEEPSDEEMGGASAEEDGGFRLF
ncbi:TRAUB-domain-containing protein [Xylariaceae sp. FL1272]|nr:TRAUB-domain-containing protein [Xylariaceae sp. FL1272]